MQVDVTALAGFAGIPLVIALVQAIKTALPSLSVQFYPLMVMGVAVVWNLGLAAYLRGDLGMGMIVGIVVGLSASGLYSNVSAIVRDSVVPKPPAS